MADMPSRYRTELTIRSTSEWHAKGVNLRNHKKTFRVKPLGYTQHSGRFAVNSDCTNHAAFQERGMVGSERLLAWLFGAGQ